MTHPKPKKDDYTGIDLTESDLTELNRLLNEMGEVFPEDSELYRKVLTEIERHPRSHEKPFRDMTLQEKVKRILELPRDVHRWAYIQGVIQGVKTRLKMEKQLKNND